MRDIGYKNSSKIMSRMGAIMDNAGAVSDMLPGSWSLSSAGDGPRDVHVFRNGQSVLSMRVQGQNEGEIISVTHIVDGGTADLVTRVCDAVAGAVDKVLEDIADRKEQSRLAKEARIREMMDELSSIANTDLRSLQDVESSMESYPKP